MGDGLLQGLLKLCESACLSYTPEEVGPERVGCRCGHVYGLLQGLLHLCECM